MQKNLHNSKKSSTFAPAFEKEHLILLLNGVMVALQILVLSVWVRVLVEQHKEETFGSLLCFNGTLTQVLISLRSND